MSGNKPTATKFTLTIDAQDINVSYLPNYIQGVDPYALLEFRSPHEPRRCIPVSETGYRSYFAPMREIEAAPSVEEYASMVALVLARQKLRGKATGTAAGRTG